MQFSLKNLSVSLAKPADKKLSLDLYFQLMKDNIANQEALVTSLDSKANNIMAVATSILTAGLGLQAIILTIESSSSTKPPTLADQIVQIVTLVVLLAAYGATMYFGFSGYRLRDWKRAFVPVSLPDQGDVVAVDQQMVASYQKTEDENKEEMTSEMLQACYANKATSDKKAASIHTANLWLSIETAVFGLYLVLQVISAFRFF